MQSVMHGREGHPKLGKNRGLGALHVKVGSDGRPVAGGPPSCAVCSGFMLDQGVTEVWLYRRDQDDEAFVWWQCYSIEEFHARSVAAHIESAYGRLRL